VADRVDETTIDSNFAENVKKVREALGISQAELARQMQEAGFPGIHPTAIRRIEAQERAVKLGEAEALARLLGRPVRRMILPSITHEYVVRMQDDLEDFMSATRNLNVSVDTWRESREMLEESLKQTLAMVPADMMRDELKGVIAAARAALDGSPSVESAIESPRGPDGHDT